MVPAFLFPKNKNPRSTVFPHISVKYCKLVCSKTLYWSVFFFFTNLITNIEAINLKHLKPLIDIAHYRNDDPHSMSWQLLCQCFVLTRLAKSTLPASRPVSHMTKTQYFQAAITWRKELYYFAFLRSSSIMVDYIKSFGKEQSRQHKQRGVTKTKTLENRIRRNMKSNCNRNKFNLSNYLLSDSFHRVLGQIKR